MKTEWYDYEKITKAPDGAFKIELIEAKEKPKAEDNGFIIDTPFKYTPTEGLTLWYRFWIQEIE